MDELVFGLVGRRLGHSWSANYFAEKFEREGIRAVYRNYEMEDPLTELPLLVAGNPRLVGLNVTIPYKQTVTGLLDELSPEAREIGAVNVIRIERRGDDTPRMSGYNTDAVGFGSTIEPLLRREQIAWGPALVLGSGGASRAVAYALRRLGLEPLTVSRTPSQGQIGYGEVTPALMRDCRVVVNTTPAGMWPDTESMPPLDPALTGPGDVVYDLIYNPDPTRWLAECARRGATVCGGLPMLRAQADAAWHIWQEED